MTQRPLTVEPSTSIARSIRLLLKHKADLLVVVGDGEHPMGTVTDSSFLSAVLDGQRLHDPVCLHMSPFVKVDSLATLDTVIEKFVLHRVRCLPVVENGRLIGLIRRRDVLANFVDQEDFAPLSTPWGDAMPTSVQPLG